MRKGKKNRHSGRFLSSKYMLRQVHPYLTVDLFTLFREGNGHTIDIVACIRVLCFPEHREWIIFRDFSLYDAKSLLDIMILASAF
jgi:hypothetical protein